jgi:hypothetical protein
MRKDFEMTDSARSLAAEASASEVRRRLTSELSLPSRLGYTALLLAGLSAATLAGALAITEEGLPARTRLAFGIMVLIGLAWAAFALWVLARRHVLFAQHRVIAARMAVAFTALFTGGSLLVGLDSGSTAAALLAGAVGAAMLLTALVVHSRASKRVKALERRRDELERRLGTMESDR